MTCNKARPAIGLPDVPYRTEGEAEVGQLLKLLLLGHNFSGRCKGGKVCVHVF